MNNRNYNLSMAGIIILSLFSFIFSNCPNGESVCLSLNGGNLDYDSSADISGFQFDHNGCVTGASGGDAGANGFTVSVGGTTVLGFSFTGGTIPAGSGNLVTLTGAGITELSGIIMSDPQGGALDFTFDPGGGGTGGGDVSGCMDMYACNYNSNATEDDGSCTYAETNYDCDGDCLNDADGDLVCDEHEVSGCTDPYANNYDSSATDNDGSCTYDPPTFTIYINGEVGETVTDQYTATEDAS